MTDHKEEKIRKELLKVSKLIGMMWSITNIKKGSGSVNKIDKENYLIHKSKSVKILQEVIMLIENDEI